MCTKWSNPVIHAQSRNREPRSSSTAVRFDRNSGLLVTFEDDQYQDRMCGLQDIGGHIMKVPLVGFQILLCMRLEVCLVCGAITLFVGDILAGGAQSLSKD